MSSEEYLEIDREIMRRNGDCLDCEGTGIELGKACRECAGTGRAEGCTPADASMKFFSEEMVNDEYE